MDRTTDPALGPVRVLLEEHLARDTSSWTMGAPGALARLTRTPEEVAQRGPNSVVTARGGLRVVLPDDAIAVAYETPSAQDPVRWQHAVAFCVPDEDARREGLRVVTELGPDDGALRPSDLAGVLFDLGLGAPAADVLVRTADAEALAVLRGAVGRDAVTGGLLAQLTAAAPDVVVRTAAGRMEITAAGAGTGLRLRPARVRQDPEPTAHIPIPDGWTTVLRLHPAHPAVEPDGRPAAFDADRDAAFRALLIEHGDPVLGVVVADVVDAVREMRGPETVDLPGDPASRAAIAVTLRRLSFTDGSSGTLAAWRGHYGPTPELADPDE